jgi:hypothetical protein
MQMAGILLGGCRQTNSFIENSIEAGILVGGNDLEVVHTSLHASWRSLVESDPAPLQIKPRFARWRNQSKQNYPGGNFTGR